MNIVVDFCLIPIGVGLSLSSYIAKCQSILKKHGLIFKLHAYGTNIEGDWDKVMVAIKECHEVLHQDGVVRISTTLKIGTRVDKKESLEEKVESVLEKKI